MPLEKVPTEEELEPIKRELEERLLKFKTRSSFAGDLSSLSTYYYSVFGPNTNENLLDAIANSYIDGFKRAEGICTPSDGDLPF